MVSGSPRKARTNSLWGESILTRIVRIKVCPILRQDKAFFQLFLRIDINRRHYGNVELANLVQPAVKSVPQSPALVATPGQSKPDNPLIVSKN